MKNDILQTINHYKGKVERITIYAISDKGRLTIQKLDLNRGGVVRYRRLKELNSRGEGIYFAPEDDCCNMLLLDDPKCLENLPNGTLVIETSPNKHQLHIPFIGEAQNEDIRAEFQRQLCQIYEADIGAVSANHLRRLPGFYNQKYTDKPMVKIIRTIEDGDPLTLKKLMKMVEKAEKQKKTKVDTKRLRRHAPPPPASNMKRWTDFTVYKDSGEIDGSRTDMRYTLYLLRMGADEEEIRQKLLQESRDIQERKQGVTKGRPHLEYYLDQTIKVAVGYIS